MSSTLQDCQTHAQNANTLRPGLPASQKEHLDHSVNTFFPLRTRDNQLACHLWSTEYGVTYSVYPIFFSRRFAGCLGGKGIFAGSMQNAGFLVVCLQINRPRLPVRNSYGDLSHTTNNYYSSGGAILSSSSLFSLCRLFHRRCDRAVSTASWPPDVPPRHTFSNAKTRRSHEKDHHDARGLAALKAIFCPCWFMRALYCDLASCTALFSLLHLVVS